MAPSPFSAAIFACPPVRDSRIAIVPEPTNNRAAATPSARSPPAVFRTSIIRRVAPDLVSDAICERSCSPARRLKEATRTYPMPAPCCRLLTSTVCGASRVSSTTWGSVVLPPRMTVSFTFEPAAPARRRCPSNGGHVACRPGIDETHEISWTDARLGGRGIVTRRHDAQVVLMCQRNADIRGPDLIAAFGLRTWAGVR